MPESLGRLESGRGEWNGREFLFVSLNGMPETLNNRARHDRIVKTWLKITGALVPSMQILHEQRLLRETILILPAIFVVVVTLPVDRP